jgi:sec-independent protein translocase protein TatC
MKTPFQEDDYFHGSTMSFGEHLEELRSVLIRALWGLALAMMVGFYFAPSVVKFFKGPIESALGEFYVNKAVADLVKRYNGSPPLEILNLVTNREMVPEYQQFELSEFVDNLTATYPGQFEALAFSPYTFVPDDFETYHTTVLWQGVGQNRTAVPAAAAFAQRLQGEGESDEKNAAATTGRLIWQALTPDEQKLVNTVAGKLETDITREERWALAAMLNRLLTNEEFHTHEAFGTTGIMPEAIASAVAKLRESLTEKSATSARDLRRLNKLLISAHFATELRPPQLTLVDVPVWKPVKIRVQSLDAQEAFMIWMKAAFVTGLVLASPWIFYQVWLFVAAGLYPHEKNYVYMYLPISLGLFAFGAALAFGFVFKPVLNFLFQFNQMMEIDPDPRIGAWLGFVLIMPLAFGISFQLPLVMLFLERIGIVTVKTYLEHWRVAILIIAVAAMILTPSADPYSMLLMMVPLVLLYFLGVAMCRYMPRHRNPFFDQDQIHEP